MNRSKKEVIYIERSQYGTYRVVDMVYNDRRARMLFGDNNSPQSGVALDDNPQLLFGYNQRFLEVAMSIQPRSILVIGGGAFTLPMALLKHFPEAVIDTVEIDSLLPPLAHQYFALPNTPRHTIIAEDGRTFIERCTSSYDLIIVDAFAGYDVPRSLLSLQAARHYARLLSPGGLVAFNIISTYRGRPALAHQLSATFADVFASAELYPTDLDESEHSEQNLLFVASQDPAPQLDYLQSYCVHPEIPQGFDPQLAD